MIKKIVFLFICILIFIGIIILLNPVNSDTPAITQFSGKTWKLTQYSQSGELIPINKKVSIFCAFTEENKISGNAGCNYFFGNYEINDGNIQISDVKLTDMISTDELLSIENIFLEALQNSTYYYIKNNSLILYDQYHNEILIFTNELPSIKERKWYLYYSDPEIESISDFNSIYIIFNQNGVIQGEFSFAGYKGNYNINDQFLNFYSLSKYNLSGMLKTESDNMELYLTLIEDVKRYKIMENQIDLFDESGKVILSYSDILPELFLNDWYPVKYGKDNIEYLISNNSYSILCFSPDGKVAGNLFNKSFIASFHVNGENMTFEQISIEKSTDVQRNENYRDAMQIISLLENIRKYSIKNDYLELFDMNDKKIITCSRRSSLQ